MLTINNVHQQFAAYFKNEKLRPFLYLVSKKLSEGHICLALNEVVDDQDFSLYYGKSSIANHKSLLKNESLIGRERGDKQPFILHNDNLYLQRYFNYESIIIQRIQQFVQNEKIKLPQRIDLLQNNKEVVIDLFPLSDKKSNEPNWQKIATINCVLNDFNIITGGPGTGKTTTVAKILTLIFNIYPGCKIALAAPTGKAASRMAEALKSALADNVMLFEKMNAIVPTTLHRLLKIAPGATKVTYNQDNPLNYDIIILDESSMIDVALFAKLMQAVGDNTKLILLGDKDQLASVEAGSLFGDLCKALPGLNNFSLERANLINSFIKNDSLEISGKNIEEENKHPLFQHIVELRVSHRFKNNEGIGRFSKAIINNDQLTIKQFFVKDFDSQVCIDVFYNDELFESFVRGYGDFINEKDILTAIKKLNNLKVLCALREGSYGLVATNNRIEYILRKHGLLKGVGEFYENRPIMVSRNYYDLQLFNGDIGIIRPDKNGQMKAWFIDNEKNLRSILPGYITDAETVFAMTIHKSQGSEFDNVLLLLPVVGDISLLTRELLYTAVTRAKKSVLIQGKGEVINTTANNSVKRISGIKDRLLNAVHK